jgi:hypothetical protein
MRPTTAPLVVGWSRRLLAEPEATRAHPPTSSRGAGPQPDVGWAKAVLPMSNERTNTIKMLVVLNMKATFLIRFYPTAK